MCQCIKLQRSYVTSSQSAYPTLEKANDLVMFVGFILKQIKQLIVVVGGGLLLRARRK